MMKVIIISIVLAILGVLYIIYNPHDPAMKGFGWFLIAVGSLVAAVFTYLWVREQTGEPEPEPEPSRSGRRRRRR